MKEEGEEIETRKERSRALRGACLAGGKEGRERAGGRGERGEVRGEIVRRRPSGQ